MGAHILLLGFLASATLAQTPAELGQDRTVRLSRVSRPLSIEQFLDGRTPEGLKPITDFRQYQPDDGKPVSRHTEAFLAYDDTYLYAVLRCREDPSRLRAHLSKREDIFSDDNVALYLDTFRDQQHVYSFYVNPLGIQSDAISTEGQTDDYSFDTFWLSQGKLTSDGYIVWMAIAFKSLRFSNAEVQTWGIGLARNIPAVNESSYWPYYTARIEGFAQQLATAEGLENISSGRNIQFIPYGVMNGTRYLDDSGLTAPAFRRRNEVRGGLDSKIVARSAVTLDFTVNPDFSQVETDDPQVTVNRRFEVYFPEKRPFFLENASYFQTPETLFFSRRIGNPEWGARMTAKSGRWLAGVLAIDDRAPGTQLSEDDPRFGDHAMALVARVQREIAPQSTVGVLYTRYAFGGASEVVGGFDARLKLLPNLVVSLQAVRSESRPENGMYQNGSAYFGEAAYSDLHFTSKTAYHDRSPGFNSSLGYIPRVDIRQLDEAMQYRWRPAGRLLKSWGPNLKLLGNKDRRNRVQDWSVGPSFTVELTGQTNLTIGRTELMELFREIKFRQHSTDVSLSTEFLRSAGIQITYSSGKRVNYDPAPGLLPFGANGKDLSVKLTLRPTSRIKWEPTYLLSHLTTVGGFGLSRPITIFDNHLLRSTLNYQFTQALSLRTILDYNGLLPNSSLASIERTKQFTGDVLLTYLLHPGTAIYIGYTDRRDNIALIDGPTPYLQRIGGPDTSTGRQLFAKISYLLRF